MVIVTADDYGKSKHATNSILECFSNKRISSVSGMVFMEDSERAAALALETGMEVGLHLNFTLPFSSGSVSSRVREHQKRVVAYLTKNKIFQLIYNPLLANSFRYLFLAQQEEFMRLYSRVPDHFNGHHHMHLCANVLAGRLIPKGARVRRTYTFDRAEKNPLNRFFRRYLNHIISRRFISSDYFFSIEPVQNVERLRRLLNRGRRHTIEIEVHPEKNEESEFLMGDEFRALIEDICVGSFRALSNGTERN